MAPEVPSLWAELEPLIERALESSLHECTAADVFGFLRDGKMVVFIVEHDDVLDFACVVESLQYPQYAVVNIVALAGKNLRGAVEFLPALQEYARWIGAVEIRGMVKDPAILRLYRRLRLPFVPVSTMVSCNLRGTLQ